MDENINELIEKLSSKVHDAWWEEKKKQGFHAPSECQSSNHKSYQKADWQEQDRLEDHLDPRFFKWCDRCHTDMYPYNELPENVKEYDRVMVKTVLQAIEELGIKLV